MWQGMLRGVDILYCRRLSTIKRWWLIRKISLDSSSIIPFRFSRFLHRSNQHSPSHCIRLTPLERISIWDRCAPVFVQRVAFERRIRSVLRAHQLAPLTGPKSLLRWAHSRRSPRSARVRLSEDAAARTLQVVRVRIAAQRVRYAPQKRRQQLLRQFRNCPECRRQLRVMKAQFTWKTELKWRTELYSILSTACRSSAGRSRVPLLVLVLVQVHTDTAEPPICTRPPPLPLLSALCCELAYAAEGETDAARAMRAAVTPSTYIQRT